MNIERTKRMSMKNLILGTMTVSALTLGVSSRSPVHAHEAARETGSAHQSIPSEVHAATEVIDRFGAALKKGDLATVKALLDSEVLVLESGGAERNRDEYLGHHAISDAEFLARAQIELLHRTARRSGDTVWVASESEIHTSNDSKPLTLISTETMVLKKVGEDWHIVHIHWSSRSKT